MARLHFKSVDGARPPIDLNWGTTVIGREAEVDVAIEHASISHRHCKVVLDAEGVRVRDCGSTNGTFIDGTPVREAPLSNGQTLRLGDVELILEYDASRVSVPELVVPETPKSYRLEDGVSCVNHAHSVAEFHCKQCRRLLCAECVRDVHRAGGKHYRFCSRCGGACERITFGSQEQRQSWLQAVKDALARPFRRGDDEG